MVVLDDSKTVQFGKLKDLSLKFLRRTNLLKKQQYVQVNLKNLLMVMKNVSFKFYIEYTCGSGILMS